MMRTTEEAVKQNSGKLVGLKGAVDLNGLITKGQT